MDTSVALNHAENCPNLDTLSAFTYGRLSEPEMAKLAQHIGTCARCEVTLREILSHPEDSFEASLLRMCSDSFTNSPSDTSGYGLALSVPYANADTRSAHAGDAAASIRTPPDATLGPYQLLNVLGRGGMGVVYRAMHQVLHRPVALKTLHPSGMSREDLLARFRIEGEAIARLDHPNVVRLHDFNEFDGIPYLSMELVDGETLASKITRGPLPIRTAVEIVQGVAGGVECAHRQNVVHRDLKPSNVLVSHNGTPKVTDFGLAKVLDEGRAKLTDTEAVMGTPCYMAPEQAAGRTREIGPLTDVYALGVMLYESLCGVPPFTASSRLELLALVQKGEIAPPSQHRQEISADLDAVCMKCLALSPKDRFASADALANELGLLLEGKRSRTRSPGWVRRTLRRKVTQRILLGLLLVAGVVGLVAALPPLQERSTAEKTPVASPDTVHAPDGTLLPFRIRYGKDQTKVTAAADGTISVHTWGLCLLEYTPELPKAAEKNEGYRFRAKIRHEGSDSIDGRVGLFFARQTFPRPVGETHLFGQMWYNDIRSPADIVANATQPIPTPVPVSRENFVRIDAKIRSEGRERPSSSTVSLAVSSMFRPCGITAANCWRDQEVVLTQTEILGTWDGRSLGTLSTAKFITSLKDAQKRLSQEEQIPEITMNSASVGGVGLLIERGSASFKQIELTPVRNTK